MQHVTRRRAILATLALFAIGSGCDRGPKTVTVTGSVVRGGQPIPVSKTGYVQIVLLPEGEEHYTTHSARCEADGAFKMVEVTPGKYRVGVEQWDPNPQVDKLNGAFRPGDSKIVCEIDGKTPLNIDLAKPKLGL